MLTCKLCKHDNPDGAMFCLNCGTLLSGSEAPKSVSGTDTVTPAPSVPQSVPSPAQNNASAAVPSILPLTPMTVNSSPLQSQQAPAPQPVSTAPMAPVMQPNPAGQQVPPVQQPQPQAPYVATRGPNSQYQEGANTVPFNSVDRQAYAQRMANPRYDAYESVSILAFVFGLVGFVFNPLYFISLAAIILGIIGQVNNISKKSLAIAGWILGIVSLIFQLAFDFICAASTCGVGAIAIFF